jgi:hypothetical protein
MPKIHLSKVFWFTCLAVLALSGLLAWLDQSGHFLQGLLGYCILLAVGAALIFGVWKAVRGNRNITTAALVAFSVRLAIGVALTLLLPVIGYQDSAEHQAGYIYADAYMRDNQAWNLAVSGEPISKAFSGNLPGDQYGGMLALSALIYRFLSPDAHRPIMIIILGAVASACGVLCLWKAVSSWFSEKTALLAAWIFALYPESVLLGSSQMREAIVIPMIAIAFYGLTEIQSHKANGWFWIILSAIFLFPIQPLVSLISFVVLAGIWLFDPNTIQVLKKRQTILTITLLVSLLLVGLFVASSILAKLPSLQGSGPLSVYLSWFQQNFTFQSYLLELSSGIFQSLLNSVGEQWRWLIILVYGTAQPVLPALVGDPGAAWSMRVIGFLRAAGWYALVLFLVYGAIGVLRDRQATRRYQLIWISIINWAWIMVSALNAGADQWDNPRYRAILLIWQVILAAWALEWARTRHDAWLWRWLAVEMVFVGLFTEWYLGRYYPGFFHLDIKIMSVVILVICGLILLGGVIWDGVQKRKLSSKDNSL